MPVFYCRHSFRAYTWAEWTGIMRDTMLQEFNRVFGDKENVTCFFAPGRVNLIGEHTDYNGGHVFPCALTIGTYAVARKRNDRVLQFYSMNFEKEGVITASLDDMINRPEQAWANYPIGVLKTLVDAGYAVDCGMDILYNGTIPNSSGLSSSASIEVLTAFIAKIFFGLNLDFVEISKLTQKAENLFIGVNCGIMDQFAIAMGKKNHAIFLDTADLSYTYAPIALNGMKLIIACSNKKRGLGDSKYNERRSQCEEALRRLQTVCKVNSLGELTEEEFETNRSVIADAILEKRAKHAVYENRRTIHAVKALQENDVKRFGELMNQSHISLRDDYEVTGIELDTLVEEAWKQDGVIGSRMTGAGFGGCTVSIVEETAVDKFIAQVGEAYEKKIGYAADFYVVEIGDGPIVIE